VALRAAKQNPILIMGKKRKPMSRFMVIMASGIARGRVRMMTTTTTAAAATESRNMAAIQKSG